MKFKLYTIAALLLSTFFCHAQTTWNGSASTNWNDAANWSNGIPGTTTAVIIPAAGTITNWPRFTGKVDIYGLTMGEGASMNVNGSSLVLHGGGLNLIGGTVPITISNSYSFSDIHIFGDAAAPQAKWYIGNVKFTDALTYHLEGPVIFYDGYAGGATVYTSTVSYLISNTGNAFIGTDYPNKYSGNVLINRTAGTSASVTNIFVSGHAGIAGNFKFVNSGTAGSVNINQNGAATQDIQGTISLDVYDATNFTMQQMSNNTAGGTINITDDNNVTNLLLLAGNTLQANVNISGLGATGNTISGNNITGNFSVKHALGTHAPVHTGGNTFSGAVSFELAGGGELSTGYTGLNADIYNGDTFFTLGDDERLDESQSYPNQYNGNLTVTRNASGNTYLFIKGHAGISGNFIFNNTYGGGGVIQLNANNETVAAIQGTVSVHVTANNNNSSWFTMKGIINNTPGGIVNIDYGGWVEMSNNTLQADLAVTNINITGVGTGEFYKNKITGNFTLSDAATNMVGIYSGGNTINGATEITLNSAASLHTGASNQGKEIHNGRFWLTCNGTGAVTIAETDNVEWNGNVRLNNTSGVSFNPAKKIIFGGSNSNIQRLGTATVIPNVEINKTGGAALTLNCPLYISNNLTFTNGNINSDATNFLQLNDNATATGANSASHVNGVVQKAGDEAFSFPVGTATTYNPVAMTASATTTDVFSAEYFNANPHPGYDTSKHAATVARVSGCEYWIVQQLNGASNISLTFTYDQPCAGPTYITNPASVHIVHWNGNSWDDLGNGGYTGTQTGTVTTAGPVSSFSPFTLASTSLVENALPLTLLSFNAKPADNGVSLNWLTTDEKNVSHFDIERSDDGAAFTKVGAVNAVSAGSTNNYVYFDAAPQSGANYYRLRMVDTDGRFEFSKIVSVRFSGMSAVTIYPVPAKSVITVQFAEQFKQLEITDISGRVLIRKNITHQSEQVDISRLARGLYYIRLGNGNTAISKKIVKD